jgi:exopolysaccharide biosynthesis polyprenyl glycosylphosphotransferase
MGALRRQLLLNTLKAFDLLLMLLSFGLATIAVSRQHSPGSLAEFLSMRVKIGNFLIFFGLLLVWHLVFAGMGMYKSRRLASNWAETADVLKATSIGTCTIILAAFLFHITMVRPVFVAVFWLAGTVLTIISRLTLRYLLKRIRVHGRNLRDMLIVGSNQRAVLFAKRIESTPELGYRIVGFADEEWAKTSGVRSSGYPLVCDLAGIPTFLRQNVVDEVVLALPMRSLHSHASDIAAACEMQGILVRTLPDVFDLKLARSRVEEFGGLSLVTHYTHSHEGWPVMVKRALDFTISLTLIVTLLPLLVLTALLVKLTSPGPVFFLQKRLGLNKRRFFVYKFRTMVADAEIRMKEIQHLNEVSGPVFKIKNDPRITPLGRFLRRTSIDELPQLLNVLKGDMSLVGPRPLPVRDYEGFSEDWQRRRFSVRPGITCLWQIGGRSSIAFQKWMELDLQYIDTWSLWLDFQILMRTIPAVLKGSGAA